MHQNGPVLVAGRAVDRNFRDGGAGDSTTFDADTVNGSHAAALVGYGARPLPAALQLGHRLGRRGLRAPSSLDYTAQAVIESYGVMV